MKLDFDSPMAQRGGQLARMLLAARRAVEEDQERAEAGQADRHGSGARLYLQVLHEVVEEARAEPDLLVYLLSSLASHAHLLLRWSASYLPYALEATEGGDAENGDADAIAPQPAGEVEMLEYLAILNDGRGLVF